MSENVKIKIYEYDKTTPAGNGTDSTDIAFVPGFSILPTAPKNVPTLVTSTREFEKLFGTQPRILTSKDITTEYEGYGFKVGDFDRSYVYAKELLYQGMPVVYSNVFSDDILTRISLSEEKISFVRTVSTAAPKDDELELIFNDKSKRIEILALKDYKQEFIISYQCSVDVKPANTDGTPQKTPVEHFINATKIDVSGKNTQLIVPFKLELTFPEGQNTDKLVTQYYTDTQIEFLNYGEARTLNLTAFCTIPVTLEKGDSVVLEVSEVNNSYLDAFYGKKPVVNTQWTTDIDASNSIADKSVYSVKYITSGGYPSVVNVKDGAISKFASEMLSAAAHRGDAISLIDYQLSPEEAVFSVESSSNSVYKKIQTLFGGVSNASFGAMMYPWGLYSCPGSLSFTDSSMIAMPPSFGYLMCVAKTIKTSPNWLAMAGVTRGIVPSLNKLLVPNNIISNAIAEEMQPKFGVENHNISINTITNIRPYGLTLWGNRTLEPVSNDGTVALNFLNTRNMLSDIKKLLYTTAKSCMFEQDSDDLWTKFKDGIRPLLDKLKAGNGLFDYKIVRGTTKYNGDPLTKGEIAAVIKIYPMFAIEFFELAVEINDQEVTVD